MRVCVCYFKQVDMFKEYEDGDENRVIHPKRDELCGNNIYLYHRYHICSITPRGYNPNKKYVMMTLCNCNHYGTMCSKCATLNTTDYFELQVPLCSEDFKTLKKILFEKFQFNDCIFYAWLVFWIDEYVKYRYDYSRQLIFWKYPKFKGMTLYNFFRYIFDYIKDSRFIYKSFYKLKPGIKIISDTCADIRCCDAMIKLSIKVYQNNKEISEILQTKKWNRIIWKSLDHNITLKKIQTSFQSIFNLCLDEIKNEVAYRPGKCKMLQSQEDFINQILLAQLKKT